MTYWSEFHKDEKMFEAIAKSRTYCKCGHSISFYNTHKDYKTCSWCGRKIYKTSQIKFKYKLMEEMRKNK